MTIYRGSLLMRKDDDSVVGMITGRRGNIFDYTTPTGQPLGYSLYGIKQNIKEKFWYIGGGQTGEELYQSR